MVPYLEPLEDRTSASGVVITYPGPGTSQIDLDALYGILNPDTGYQISIVGNSNPAGIKTSLSDGELGLKFTGSGTITIGITNPDGSSVRNTIQIITQ